MGSLASMFCLSVALLTPFIFAFMIHRNIHKIEKKSFVDKLGSLTERLRSTMLSYSRLPLYSNIFDYIRTLITVVVLVRLRVYPGVQAMILLCVSVLKQAYILHARPFTEPIENRIALFNEYLISIYIYGIFLLTDYNTSDELRYYVSLLLVGVIGVYILVNFGNFIILALI